MKPQDADGRWGDILRTLGIDRRFLTNRHGPCPICGGKDRWRFDDKDGRGTWFCSRCGAGDGFRLIMLHQRCNFPEVIKMVESVIGSARIEPPRDRICEDAARERANRMWRECQPIGEIVTRYLASRRLDGRTWQGLRSHPALEYGREGPTYPAMVAMVHDAAGKPATLHRTYLRADGTGKADVPAPRRTSHGLTIPKGAAIRLAAVETRMGIAEGIETAMAATILFGLPVWCALNAGNLSAWNPPDGIDEVVIFADKDRNFVGQSAAYHLAERLAKRGLKISVKCPIISGSDWADVLALGNALHPAFRSTP